MARTARPLRGHDAARRSVPGRGQPRCHLPRWRAPVGAGPCPPHQRGHQRSAAASGRLLRRRAAADLSEPLLTREDAGRPTLDLHLDQTSRSGGSWSSRPRPVVLRTLAPTRGGRLGHRGAGRHRGVYRSSTLDGRRMLQSADLRCQTRGGLRTTLEGDQYGCRHEASSAAAVDPGVGRALTRCGASRAQRRPGARSDGRARPEEGRLAPRPERGGTGDAVHLLPQLLVLVAQPGLRRAPRSRTSSRRSCPARSRTSSSPGNFASATYDAATGTADLRAVQPGAGRAPPRRSPSRPSSRRGRPSAPRPSTRARSPHRTRRR